MRREAILYYSAGDKNIPVARLLCCDDRISYELEKHSPEVPYDSRTIDETVRFLIDLPVRLYKLRHKTMPDCFGEVVPGSMDHFNLIKRRYGSFRLVPASPVS